MLNINFVAKSATAEHITAFVNAVWFERCDMEVSRITAEIASLSKKIANEQGKYSVEQVKGFEAERASKQVDLDSFKTEIEKQTENHTTVITNMTAVNDAGFGNSKDTVRTVFRVIAACENSKLMQYAMIPVFEDESLYDALEEVHIRSIACEDGSVKQTKEVKSAYKQAKDRLETIVKDNFSLAFETPYTDKIRVKLNATDFKLLHDCYVTGFNNKMTEDEDGNLSYSGRKMKTLVSVKGKGKKKTVNYSKLAKVICDIVVEKYCK